MSVVRLIRRYERRRRFWRQVEVLGPEECWPWRGRTDAHGHGVYDGAMAHERAYELARRSLPPGAWLERRCGTAGCVNPRHFELREPT